MEKKERFLLTQECFLGIATVRWGFSGTAPIHPLARRARYDALETRIRFAVAWWRMLERAVDLGRARVMGMVQGQGRVREVELVAVVARRLVQVARVQSRELVAVLIPVLVRALMDQAQAQAQGLELTAVPAPVPVGRIQDRALGAGVVLALALALALVLVLVLVQTAVAAPALEVRARDQETVEQGLAPVPVDQALDQDQTQAQTQDLAADRAAELTLAPALVDRARKQEARALEAARAHQSRHLSTKGFPSTKGFCRIQAARQLPLRLAKQHRDSRQPLHLLWAAQPPTRWLTLLPHQLW